LLFCFVHNPVTGFIHEWQGRLVVRKTFVVLLMLILLLPAGGYSTPLGANHVRIAIPLSLERPDRMNPARIDLALSANFFPLNTFFDWPEGFWKGNKQIIVGFCLFIIAQSFIIGFLVRNMIRRREAEEALRGSEERFRLAFQISPDAIMISRLRDGVYTDVNKDFTFLVGYGKDEVVGKSSRDIVLWDNAKQERDFYARVREKRFVNNLQAKFRLKDGSIITGLISASLFLHQGEPHVLAAIRNIESIKRSENKIRQLAYFDILTGLPNRSLFYDRLDQALRQARREDWKVALLFFDLDRFKWVNDTLGHAIGDLLLQKVSQRLQKILRKSDTLARMGGDEFVLLLNSVNNIQNVTAVARKVQLLMNSPFELEGKRIQTSSSIGIAIFPQDGEDVETLMKNADLAMYSAKEKERNNFQFFSDELNQKAKVRRDLEQNMSRALEKKEFFLVYQPQISLADGALISCEALIRWRHPEKGILEPGSFIPLAEETGFIHQLGEWVLRTACTHICYLQDKAYPSFRVAVNLAGRQFRQANLLNLIDQILSDTGLDPCFLELELTESTLMTGVENTLKTLRELKSRGIYLTIDDFGTGYSSLSCLKHFSIDRLKISRTFVRDIPHDPDNGAIVKAIIGMAHRLNLKVVGEGIETRDQLDFLRNQNCQEMQGFYFAPPMPLEELAAFIRDGYETEGAFTTAVEKHH
jgi:diguanylate cyclase (GGDEF)-like protein/PAS domain S-box-containing protein